MKWIAERWQTEAIRTALILSALGEFCSELMKCPEERLRHDLPAASRRQDHGAVPGVDASERPQIHEAKRTTPINLSTKAAQ
jgi:hypothetical protein